MAEPCPKCGFKLPGDQGDGQQHGGVQRRDVVGLVTSVNWATIGSLRGGLRVLAARNDDWPWPGLFCLISTVSSQSPGGLCLGQLRRSGGYGTRESGLVSSPIPRQSPAARSQPSWPREEWTSTFQGSSLPCRQRARYLPTRHPSPRCLVINEGSLKDDLTGVDIVGPDSPSVVLLGGAGASIGYGELDSVFKLALDGVPIVALHRNTRFQTAEVRPWTWARSIVGLEAAAGIEIPVVGKPAPEFFRGPRYPRSGC